MAKKYDFSAFDKPAPSGGNYDFSAFDEQKSREPSGEATEDSLLDTAGDALHGVAQGATFGFADEIEGGLGAAGDVITGRSTLEKIMDSYRANRDSARQRYDKAAERSPIANTVGNIGGGIVSGIATAGMGGAASGATALSRILNAAKIGGISGTVAGVGTSEGDLTKGEIRDVAGDALTGAGMGALIGGGLQTGIEGAKAAYSGIKSAKDAIVNSRTAKDFTESLKLGAEGTNIVTDEGLAAAEKNIRDATKEFALDARQAQKAAGAEVGAAKQAGSNTKFDLTEEIQSIKDTIEKLKQSDNPEAIKNVKLLQDYLDNLLLGKAEEVPFQFSKYSPSEKTPAVASAREKLEQEAAKLAEQARLQGENPKFDIQESPDKRFLSLLKATDENIGAPERAVPILDIEGNPTGQFKLDAGDTSDAFKSGLKIKTVENTPGIPESVIPAQKGELVSDVAKVRRGGIDTKSVSFDKAGDIKGTLNDFTGASGGTPKLDSQEAINVLKQQAKSVSDKMSTATPELATANQKYASVKQAFDILGIDPTGDFIKDASTGKIRLSLNAEQKINNVIKRMARETDAGENASYKLGEALRLLENADPKMAQALRPKIEKASRVLDLSQKAQRLGLLNKSTLIKSGSVQVGNRLGLGIKKLSDASPDQIKLIAQDLMNKGGAGMKLVEPLVQAMRKDNIGRNAALFAIQQNPEYRQIINQYFDDEEKAE